MRLYRMLAFKLVGCLLWIEQRALGLGYSGFDSFASLWWLLMMGVGWDTDAYTP